MKKILPVVLLTLLFLGCVYATDSHVEINDVDFKIPPKYQGGELDDEMYELENIFSIRCVDDDLISTIGLWAEEADSSEDVDIDNHPTRHFSQYNKYVDGNHSHAYFASGESVYEISWVGENIDKNIKKIIKNTPESEIDKNNFFNVLDEAYKIYKAEKIDKLNRDSEYNYIEAKYKSQTHTDNNDNTRLKQILYTYYLNRK